MSVRTGRKLAISGEMIRQYAWLSGDDNPIHMSQQAAENEGFQAPVAHGILTMGLIGEMAAEGLSITSYEMRFFKPVHQGDNLEILVEAQRNGGTLYKVAARNQDGQVVVKGKMVLDGNAGETAGPIPGEPSSA
ncbi:MaoC family dehydratase [Virgibacillus sediminis]|uniref:MaoC family dehydratase n=1 Tax=Virgibacillus sediminis TaxID=202260 RepID=A0ABV7A968_9BACI